MPVFSKEGSRAPLRDVVNFDFSLTFVTFLVGNITVVVAGGIRGNTSGVPDHWCKTQFI